MRNSKYKNIKKIRNKIIEILVKSKIPTLPKFKFKNLSRFENFQTTSTTKKPNFLVFRAKVIFIK